MEQRLTGVLGKDDTYYLFVRKNTSLGRYIHRESLYVDPDEGFDNMCVPGVRQLFKALSRPVPKKVVFVISDKKPADFEEFAYSATREPGAGAFFVDRVEGVVDHYFSPWITHIDDWLREMGLEKFYFWLEISE